MAKRKRLTPAQPEHFDRSGRAPETKSMPIAAAGPGFSAPPIAQVAGDTATHAALDEVSGMLRDARAQGRLIEALPLGAIDAGHMLRDRILKEDDEDMQGLIVSLRARGQQTPIEVIALPDAEGAAKYGLISGWRRLTALNRLYQDTGEARFATIKALVIAPDTAQDAYVAMVEENEVRVNLSLYERARIALHAAKEGVFPTARHAILALFETAPRAKRSKISSFVALVEALDSALRFPTAIPEKLGLTLARALAEDAGLARRIRDRLAAEAPESPAEELQILARLLTAKKALTGVKEPEKGPREDSDPLRPAPTSAPTPTPTPAPLRPGEVVPGLLLRINKSAHMPRIELTGEKVDDALYHALRAWLTDLADGEP